MSVDNSRIARNTVYLYIRMLFVLGANFFAVRLLLETLGVEDYGLFNLIVGFVTIFTLLNGAMQSTVQRFLCFELGKEAGGDTKAVFAACLVLFAALAGLILLSSETVGLWFATCRLNIPPTRAHSAAIVYQLGILVMIFKTIQIPFTALIVSYEQMSAFAKISIVEAVLTLGAALVLKFLGGDRLVWYAAFFTTATGVVMLAYVVFCRVHFTEARFPRQIGRAPAKELGAFFSWSVFGAIANMLKQQGLNVLLNIFFGVALNATWALSNKIGMAVNQLVSNFQQAFNPQIVKSWSAEDKRPFLDLLLRTSRWSFLLIWIFALPLLVFPEFFLRIWLKGDLPPQLAVFVQCFVVYLVFNAMSGPLWMAVQATGRIAAYQIQVSLIIAMAFFVGWITLALGCPAWSVAAVNAVMAFICLVYRLSYVCRRLGLSVLDYGLRVATPMAAVAVASYCGLLFLRGGVR